MALSMQEKQHVGNEVALRYLRALQRHIHILEARLLRKISQGTSLAAVTEQTISL